MKSFLLAAAFVVLAGCSAGADKSAVGDQAKDQVGGPKTSGSAPVASKTPAGWAEIKTSGIALSFPPDWKAVDLTKKDMIDAITSSLGNDPASIEMKNTIIKFAGTRLFKLFVFGPVVQKGFRENCNVIVQTLPTAATVDQIIDASMPGLKKVVLPGTTPEVTKLQTPVGEVAKVVSHAKNAKIAEFVSIAYYAVHDKTMVIVTYTALPEQQKDVEPLSEQGINSLRFE